MPPKVKTTKETILNAAFEVAKSSGVTSITAQSVSKVLKTSVAPIFREFQTVEELRNATMERIYLFHIQFIKNYPLCDSEFLSYGIAYIHFAKIYPLLFETIMQSGIHPLEEQMSGRLQFVMQSVGKESGLGYEMAKELFFNSWIYTHGIACLVYKGSLALTDDQEKKLLMTAFFAFYQNICKGDSDER